MQRTQIIITILLFLTGIAAYGADLPIIPQTPSEVENDKPIISNKDCETCKRTEGYELTEFDIAQYMPNSFFKKYIVIEHNLELRIFMQHRYITLITLALILSEISLYSADRLISNANEPRYMTETGAMTDELQAKIANYLFLVDGQLLLFAEEVWNLKLLNNLSRISQKTQQDCQKTFEKKHTDIWQYLFQHYALFLGNEMPGLFSHNKINMNCIDYNHSKTQAHITIEKTPELKTHVITLKWQENGLRAFITNEDCTLGNDPWRITTHPYERGAL
jgi:hypothetical protein